MKRKTIEQRLSGKFDKRGESDCWPWLGQIDKDGYGRAGEGRGAHRLMYQLIAGPIAGLTIDHVCHNRDLTCRGGVTCLHRRCVNPAHLEAVTSAENHHRGDLHRGRGDGGPPPECVNGHAYTPENTYVRPDGHHDCRACIRDRVRRYKTRRAIAA